jgi:hypothetical protein
MYFKLLTIFGKRKNRISILRSTKCIVCLERGGSKTQSCISIWQIAAESGSSGESFEGVGGNQLLRISPVEISKMLGVLSRSH